MRTLKILAGLAIVAGSLAIALPAGAHTDSVTGTASCSDGSHLVTWSITNLLATRTMTVTATAEASGVTYAVSGIQNPVAGGGNTDATTVVPGGITGSVTITVNATWNDGFMRTETATVALPTSCSTSTTTAAPTTTTPPTTTAPTTTVPQSVEGVSTSVAPTTTAPTGVLAAQCGPDTLACTGSDTGTPAAVGFGLLVVGAGLVALKRRPSRTSD
jgi:LPXTG-motif cell wall-anchored protein